MFRICGSESRKERLLSDSCCGMWALICGGPAHSPTRPTQCRVNDRVCLSSGTCAIASLTYTSCRSPNHVLPMPRHITVELLAPIFWYFTSEAELSNLCLVSRAFRHEAQRILYHTIRLPNDHDRFVSWCDAIVANPHLAMQVYSLSLPAGFEYGQSFTVEPDIIRQERRHVVKRALSSLPRLAELRTYFSFGKPYLSFDIFCGHPFRLQVFDEDPQCPCSPEHWLGFLSEQPGIRHLRLNVCEGHALDPDVLPLLTSAEIYSPALSIFARCPMIRALQVMRWPYSDFDNDLLTLKAFRHKLTSLSLEVLNFLEAIKIIRDIVPHIKFLGLRSERRVSPLVRSLPHLIDAACMRLQKFHSSANLPSELSGFPHLTTLVLELSCTENRIGFSADPEQALSLVTGFINANAMLRRVAFETRYSEWPCYIRAQAGLNSNGDGTAVFEGFGILGPDSWKDVYD
jgi:hypothetical protein